MSKYNIGDVVCVYMSDQYDYPLWGIIIEIKNRNDLDLYYIYPFIDNFWDYDTFPVHELFNVYKFEGLSDAIGSSSGELEVCTVNNIIQDLSDTIGKELKNEWENLVLHCINVEKKIYDMYRDVYKKTDEGLYES